MLGPWENNEIYTLRHSAESGDRLSNVIPHCQESSWDLQMREKRKGSSHEGERACAKAQRHETAWVYEKCTWNKKGNHWEGVWVHAMRPGIPWFAVIPMLPPMRKLFFISSLTPQRSIEDKGTGWRDGNQPGHSVKKEVKPVLKRKAEMMLLWLFLPKVQS